MLKVSIVIPTYNRAHLLTRAINSILEQTYQNWELIIVDDCSQDNTQEIVESYDNSRITYIRNQTNRGASASRNIGIKQSQGDWVAFLDSDDEWDQNKLQKQIEVIDSETVLISTDSVKKSNNQTITQNHPRSLSNQDSVLANNLHLNTSSLLIRKDILKGISGFDTKLSSYEDWDLIAKIYTRYGYTHKLLNIPKILTTSYVSDNSLSITENFDNRYNGFSYLVKNYETLLQSDAKLWNKYLIYTSMLAIRAGKEREARFYLRKAQNNVSALKSKLIIIALLTLSILPKHIVHLVFYIRQKIKLLF